MRALLVLCLLLLASPARAEGGRVLVFQTEPPGARVFLQVSGVGGKGHELGLSGQPIPFSLEGRDPSQNFQFSFELPGHRFPAGSVRVQFSVLKDATGEVRFPQEGGSYRLEPDNAAVALRDFLVYRWPLALGLVALAGGALAVEVPRRRRIRLALERSRWLESLQAKASDAWPLLGTVLGRYRLVDRLGRGGMATVYRGVPDEQGERGEPVAVKVMNPAAVEDPEFRKRFEREVRIGQQLDHPHIVRILDWGEQGDLLYLVQEEVRGENLRARVRPAMPVDEALGYLRPALEAVAFAHDRGIVHRDLKPDNLMVDHRERLKVMDFGLARGHQFSTVTVSGSALGTPAYMAPEQIAGLPPSASMDQYALGVVLYELLAGRRPFDDEDTMALILKHLSEPPPPLREGRPDLPERLAAVVERMLAKEPAERYPDLRAVLADLA